MFGSSRASNLQTKTSIPKFEVDFCFTKMPDLDSLEESAVLQIDDIDNEYQPFRLSNLQLYNPIYSILSNSNEKSFQDISLKHPCIIDTMDTVITRDYKTVLQKPVFIKFAPLLDPIRYMIGKYESDPTITILPQPDLSVLEIQPHKKLLDHNNTSYVDNFFSFLTSKLLHHYGFVHGLEYFGSFLGLQEKFKANITDDLEYLNTSSHFLQNKNKMFSISTTNFGENDFTNFGSRNNKNKIEISGTDLLELDVVSLEEELSSPSSNGIAEIESVYENKNTIKSTSSDDTNSSSNSEINYSTDGEEEPEEGSQEDWETDEDSSEFESDEEEEDSVHAYIPNFPVQLICLEKCDGTVDSLLETKKMNSKEIASFLFQTNIMLLVYQQTYHFTHNDLHTNNIMYINTDVEFLYYKFKNQVYKVPTYGRIYKLIDFGRGIYRFGGNIFCSDSFASSGDAATQYNCEPFMNEDKPRLDPNPSFDLCRLGCSLYDFFIDENENPKGFNEIQKTVYRWCLDDQGKNILYKKNGDERYPNFKLYKMISRTVHNHTPEEQFKFPLFQQYEISNITDTAQLMDIDSFPSYTSANSLSV